MRKTEDSLLKQDMDTTLDYLDVPSTATLLHSSKFQPAPKITTALPTPSPPISVPTSPTTDSVSQFILSATLPTGLLPPSTPPSASASSSPPQPQATPPPSHTRNPSKSHKPTPLLSAKDPLSLPITSTNFRRFVVCVGPVFWLQDRVEEIVLWKQGWKWTTLWILIYGGLCRFPQLILCIPHIALIAVILATYPYSVTQDPALSPSPSISQPSQRPASSQSQDSSSGATSSSLATLPYQTNLQGIQNLMGAFSDLMDSVKPLVCHLMLNPASLSTLSHSRSASPSSSTNLTTQPSPYTTHILTFLVLTFPPLLVLVSLPSFPLRLVMFIAGAGPICALHPRVKDELLPSLIVLAEWAWSRPVPKPIIHAYMRVVQLTRIIFKFKDKAKGPRRSNFSCRVALKSLIERLIDNDRFSDECWASEMRQVELWENERYVGPVESGGQQPTLATKPSYSSFSSIASLGSLGSLKSLGSLGSIGSRKGTWSKANLRATDLAGWTRRRDGWNGTNAVTANEGEEKERRDEEYDGVDSRLTFPLAPGWAFVESEDWKDGCAEWVDGDRVAAVDEDGWVYTNDVWMEGGPYVTRRRRWVRRVWFDPDRAREYRVQRDVGQIL